MKNCRFLRLFLLVLIILTSLNVFARNNNERFQLSVGSSGYMNGGRVFLKFLLKQQYQDVDVKSLLLKKVILKAKANGQANVSLQVGSIYSKNYNFTNTPRKTNLLSEVQRGSDQKGQWRIHVQGVLKIIKLVVVAEILAPAMDNTLCGRFTAYSETSSPFDSKWQCAGTNFDSNWIMMGDDKGWRNQRLQIINNSYDKICLRHYRVSPRGQEIDTGWECSTAGELSPSILIGDDKGWKNQKMMIRTNSRTRSACLHHSRLGSRGYYKPDWACSFDNKESDWILLGDDTGWADQKIQFGFDYDL